MLAEMSKLLGNPERIRGGNSALGDSYCKFSEDKKAVLISRKTGKRDLSSRTVLSVKIECGTYMWDQSVILNVLVTIF